VALSDVGDHQHLIVARLGQGEKGAERVAQLARAPIPNLILLRE
jgi:hypothetical protein